MRLSDYKGEEALDLIADIMEPIASILEDKEFQDNVQVEGSMLKTVRTLLKGHKGECIQILARIEGVPAEEYKPGVILLTKNLMEFMSDPEIKELFISQGQIETAASSGSATENTGDAEK